MFFDFSHLAARDAYKLLAASVVPRPIALITSLNEQGKVNAAPYSFFNAIGSDPALVVVGISDGDSIKDTGRNIRTHGEFVVNLVSRPMAEAMNICAIDFPCDVSEVEVAHLQTAPSQITDVPRLTASPVSIECQEHTTLQIGHNRIVIGRVLGLWVQDEFIDEKKLYVDTAALDLIGRMGGAGGYTNAEQSFEMERISYREWCTENPDYRQ